MKLTLRTCWTLRVSCNSPHGSTQQRAHEGTSQTIEDELAAQSPKIAQRTFPMHSGSAGTSASQYSAPDEQWTRHDRYPSGECDIILHSALQSARNSEVPGHTVRYRRVPMVSKVAIENRGDEISLLRAVLSSARSRAVVLSPVAAKVQPPSGARKHSPSGATVCRTVGTVTKYCHCTCTNISVDSTFSIARQAQSHKAQ